MYSGTKRDHIKNMWSCKFIYLISFLSYDSECKICIIPSTSRSATIKTNNATSKNEENLCFVWWVNFFLSQCDLYLLRQSRWFHLPIRELSSPIPRWTTKASPCAFQTNNPTILGQIRTKREVRAFSQPAQQCHKSGAVDWTRVNKAIYLSLFSCSSSFLSMVKAWPLLFSPLLGGGGVLGPRGFFAIFSPHCLVIA